MLGIFRFFISCFCFLYFTCGIVICTSEDEFGYGLIGVKDSIFSINNKFYDRTEFFVNLSQNAQNKRSEYLNKKFKGTESVDTKKCNIVSFAFEFFNEEGDSLSGPVYYGHNNVNNPYYFLSGQHLLKDLPEDVLALENFLGQTDLKKEDYLKIYKLKQEINTQKQTLLNFSNIAGINKELAGHICDGYAILIKDLEDKLSKKISPINKMWFDHIINRSISCKDSTISWDRVLKCMHSNNKSLCILDERKDFRPNVIATDEGVFVHSEQLGLAHMHQKKEGSLKENFKIFLENIKISMSDPHKVKYLIMYEYTYNSSCKRCARSIWYDFNNTLKSIIHEIFQNNVRIHFMVAATKSYADTAFRKDEPDSPIDGPNDYQLPDGSVIDFSTNDIENYYIYQYIISEHSLCKKEIYLRKTKAFYVFELRNVLDISRHF